MCSSDRGVDGDVVVSEITSTESDVVGVEGDSGEAEAVHSFRKRGRYRSQDRGRRLASSRANQS